MGSDSDETERQTKIRGTHFFIKKKKAALIMLQFLTYEALFCTDKYFLREDLMYPSEFYSKKMLEIKETKI